MIDRDWDNFLGLSHDTGSVIYTDYCCREACLWSEQVFRRLIIQFRADKFVNTREKFDVLYQSIVESCAEIAAVRITNERFPDFGLGIDYSDRAFSFVGGRVILNIEMVIAQSKPSKGMAARALARVKEIAEEIRGCDRRFLCHGHDLLFIATFALREASAKKERELPVEHVENAFSMIGLIEDHVSQSPAMLKLENWLK